jgi:signal peptidase II
MNKKVISISFFIVLIDQITKYFAVENLSKIGSIPIVYNIFHLTFTTNTGVAFGMFKGINFLFIFISLLVITIVAFNYKSFPKGKLRPWIVGLIIGGGIGNLIDRIFRGSVVDFLDFRVWPIFNIADSAVSIAIVLLIYLVLTEKN